MGDDEGHSPTGPDAPDAMPRKDDAPGLEVERRSEVRSPVGERLVGDGLVPLHSALGIHDDPARTLGFAKARQAMFYRLGHLDLLADAGVARQLQDWMQDH